MTSLGPTQFTMALALIAGGEAYRLLVEFTGILSPKQPEWILQAMYVGLHVIDTARQGPIGIVGRGICAVASWC